MKLELTGPEICLVRESLQAAIKHNEEGLIEWRQEIRDMASQGCFEDRPDELEGYTDIIIYETQQLADLSALLKKLPQLKCKTKK